MASIKFIVKPSKSKEVSAKDKAVPIYIRLIAGRLPGDSDKKIDVMAKTKFLIKPSDWSTAKESPKNTTDEGFKKLKHDLLETKTELLKQYNKLANVSVVSTLWLKEFLSPSGSVDGYPSTLVEYFDYYVKARAKSLTESSVKKMNVVKHKLERYEKEHGKIYIRNVNRRFQESFEAYCDKHNYAVNTIAKELKFVKTICKHAKDNGVETHYQLDSLKIDFEKVDSIYLTEKDLSCITKVELNESLDNVRDWLLISCYTGQRVSDFLRFQKTMIRTQVNRQGNTITLIEFEQKKTGKKMTLPLRKEVLSILQKRGGDFPRTITDQKYNEYIKTVCRTAKITDKVTGSKKSETFKGSGIFRKEAGLFEKCDLVTSHIGRRTFATINYGKIPTSLLIAATGHSTEQMFLNYIGKSASDRALELAEWF